MKVEISQATYDFVLEQLKLDDQECAWELAGLAPQHKMDNTNLYVYWKNKQETIKNALKELRRGI
jgi:hypothetical protein